MAPIGPRISRRQFVAGSALAAAALGTGMTGTAAAATEFDWTIGPDVLATIFNTSDCDLGIVNDRNRLWIQTSWWPDWRRYVGTTMDDIVQVENGIRDSSFTQPHGDDAYWTGGIWADEDGVLVCAGAY